MGETEGLRPSVDPLFKATGNQDPLVMFSWPDKKSRASRCGLAASSKAILHCPAPPQQGQRGAEDNGSLMEAQDPWEQVPCAPPKDPGGLSLSHALWFQLRAGSLSAPTQGKLSQRVPLFFQLAGGQRSSEKGLLRKSHCLFAPSHGHCLAEHSAATSCECDHENMQIWMRRHAEQAGLILSEDRKDSPLEEMTHIHF